MNDECLRYVFHDESERRDVVGGAKRVGVAEIDLVLAVRHFVVRRFHLEPHLLQHSDDRPARVLSEIRRREIEVAADIVRHRGRRVVGSGLEHEELRFHPGVHRVAELVGAGEDFLQHPSRIPGKRAAVGRVYVADDARDAILLLSPRKDLKRSEIGRQQHVRLLDAHEPFY
jgi:hypothetical protein